MLTEKVSVMFLFPEIVGDTCPGKADSRQMEKMGTVLYPPIPGETWVLQIHIHKLFKEDT